LTSCDAAFDWRALAEKSFTRRTTLGTGDWRALALTQVHRADLGTVAVFEHRLDLIKQVMEEWKKWAELLRVRGTGATLRHDGGREPVLEIL